MNRIPRPERTRGGRGAIRTLVVAVAVLAAGLAVIGGAVTSGSGAGADALQPVPGTDAPRPRLLYDPGAEPSLRQRLEREPYRSIFVLAHQKSESWDNRTLGDLSVNAQRDLTRAAKQRAFEYALDRTVVGGAVVPFADEAARQAAGDQVRRILLQMLDRSRLAVPPPIGGWDRDISTSEEIINTATAFDTLVGAGFELTDADRAEIVRRIASVTEELHENYVNPASASGYADLHQNNHRAKSGAAMAVAAVALADEVPAEQVRRWFDTGVDYVDDTQRNVLIAGDGAYAEGPFYAKYSTQNLVPFLAAWERFLGASSWTTASGLRVPALAHTPLYARTQRWMLDLTLPDGSLAPIDDGNPGRSQYFGALPPGLPTASAAAWRWANAPQPFETDGNIDLTPEAIVAFDDSVPAGPPTWAPTQFYVEGGNAVLRGGWGADDAEALVLGEHDTASEFGRDRTGVGRSPQSHEHADPASYLFHAFGERLAIDPGYLSFSEHNKVNKPEDHNVVLVDGRGPADYLGASIAWASDPTGRPPAEGQSTIARTLDSDIVDAASVVTDYRGAAIDRRFLFGDDRYLVVADTVRAPAGTDLTWLLHGNGGGSSGGTFEGTPTGGRWTIGGARLDGAVASTDGEPVLSTAESIHEVYPTQERTHTALHADLAATGDVTRAVQVLYPSRSGAAAPQVTREGGRVRVVDEAGDRRLMVDQTVAGRLSIADHRLDGTLRSAWTEGVATLDDGGRTLVRSSAAGTLGIRPGAERVDVVAETASPTVEVADPGFRPATVDGACGLSVARDGTVTLRLNRERRATLRAGKGNGRPGADAGPQQRAAVGSTVALDGSASCDPDGDALTPHWELVSAPGGSAWALTGADSWSPSLAVDRTGPYRVRLVVTDSRGARSLEAEAVVIGGPRCGDGVDDDLDGRIDTDDPDCDGPEPTPPASSTTTITVAPTTPELPPPPASQPPTTPTTSTPGPVPTRTISAQVAPTDVHVGELAHVRGALGPDRFTPRVVVQRLVDGRWEDRATGSVDPATGRFDVPVRPSQWGNYALRVRSGGGTVTSRTVYLRVHP